MVLMFRGKPACDCLFRWLGFYERELKARGVVAESIDVAQLIGNAAASAGVHSQGGAFDIRQTQPEAVWVARQMGADATWARTGAAWAGNEHTHGVLRGCPHNGPARYQIEAVERGYNGLGRGGMGAPDDGPRPLSYRNWQEGIAWHHEQAEKRRRAALTARIVEAVTQKKRLARVIARLRARRDAL